MPNKKARKLGIESNLKKYFLPSKMAAKRVLGQRKISIRPVLYESVYICTLVRNLTNAFGLNDIVCYDDGWMCFDSVNYIQLDVFGDVTSLRMLQRTAAH